MRDGQHRHVEAHLLHLPDDERGALGVTRDHKKIGLERPGLGQGGCHVVEFGRKLVVDHDLESQGCGVLEHACTDVLAERVVLEGTGKPDACRVAAFGLRDLGCEGDGTGEILFGRREHGEQVPVALGEELPGRAVRLDHRHAVLFGDRRDGLGEPGTVRAQHEGNAVLVDQSFRKLRAAGRGRFVVVVDDADIVLPTVDRNPARFVDRPDGKVITLLRVLAVGRILAGKRDCRAKVDRVAIHLGLDSRAGGKKEPKCR